MRPAEDLAERARNWFWYWMVRRISGLSNEALDQKFLRTSERIRRFEVISESASSPAKIALRDGRTLLELVDMADRPAPDRPGPFAPATQAFESPFWDFLIPNGPRPAYRGRRSSCDASDLTSERASLSCSEFIQSYVHERGWLRLPNGSGSLYEIFLGPDEPAVEMRIGTAYSAMLHKLVAEQTLEAVAVLMALFREAIHNVDLKRAAAIKVALKGATTWLCQRYEMPDRMTKLLDSLVFDRILKNLWLTKADWQRAAEERTDPKINSRDRIKEFQRWVDWYISHPREGEPRRFGAFPIVPQSARTRWVESNRDALKKLNKAVWERRDVHGRWHDSPSIGARHLASQAKEEEARILLQVAPPLDPPERFFEEPPSLEIANLPKCY